MFGSISKLFAAIGRLTASIEHSADLFDVANKGLEKRFGFGEDSPSERIEQKQEEEREALPAARNGKRK
jgi:hypothetical protein